MKYGMILLLLIFALLLMRTLLIQDIPVGVFSVEEVLSAIPSEAAETTTMQIDKIAQEVQKELAKRQARRLQFLAAGYLSIWLVLMGYALYLSQRQSKLRKHLESLRKLLEK